MDNNPNVRRLSLLSFIIKPVQRLCKYPLLIRVIRFLFSKQSYSQELIRNTDSSSKEYAALSIAAEAVNKTVQFVNKQQDAYISLISDLPYSSSRAERKLAENREFISKLEKSIKGAEILQLSADVNREIGAFSVHILFFSFPVKVGDLQKVDLKKKKFSFRRVFCFNNLVVIAEPKKKVTVSSPEIVLIAR